MSNGLQVPPGVRVIVDPNWQPGGSPQPAGTLPDGRPFYADDPGGKREADVRWLIGFAGLWLVLSIMADNPSSQQFASILSLVVAGSATLLMLPNAAKELGF